MEDEELSLPRTRDKPVIHCLGGHSVLGVCDWLSPDTTWTAAVDRLRSHCGFESFFFFFFFPVKVVRRFLTQ